MKNVKLDLTSRKGRHCVTPTEGVKRETWLERYNFYRASDYHHNSIHHKVEHSLVCGEGQGMISRSDLTQDIEMGSYVFQFDVPH